MQIKIFVERKDLMTEVATVVLRERWETLEAEDAASAVRELIAAKRFPGAMFAIASDVLDEVNVFLPPDSDR